MHCQKPLPFFWNMVNFRGVDMAREQYLLLHSTASTRKIVWYVLLSPVAISQMACMKPEEIVHVVP